MRKFNTTGLCVPERHYMVDISGRVAQIRAMVDAGDFNLFLSDEELAGSSMSGAGELGRSRFEFVDWSSNP